ncbi:MAG: hypothetical protein ACKVS7_11545 [Gemmatimonadaceae bacterium]
MSVALLLLTSAACGKKDSEAAADVPAADVPAASAMPSDAAAPAGAVATKAFDLAAIPMAKDTLPAFPFVEWPDYVPADSRSVEASVSLDELTVIAGEQLVTLEGRLERRSFSIPEGKSTFELRRFYRDRITALGGVKVNTLQPTTDNASIAESVEKLFPADANPATRLGLQSYDEGQYQYEVYVVRTAKANAWFVVQTSTYSVIVTAIAADAK